MRIQVRVSFETEHRKERLGSGETVERFRKGYLNNTTDIYPYDDVASVVDVEEGEDGAGYEATVRLTDAERGELFQAVCEEVRALIYEAL